ncbi:hypothetical protein KGQ34_04485 [Patescibacteria group bacterium]|nr:hypothetical protein [Patescibacteria group bacterium]
MFCLFNFLLPKQYGYATEYPPEIQKQIAQAGTPIVCETESPRRVGTIAYTKRGEPWLIRVFTRDGHKLEIWFNESISRFSLLFGITDKVYFYENGQWFDQDNLPEEESRRLDRRLKFTGAEKRFFKECFEQKRNAAP